MTFDWQEPNWQLIALIIIAEAGKEISIDIDLKEFVLTANISNYSSFVLNLLGPYKYFSSSYANNIYYQQNAISESFFAENEILIDKIYSSQDTSDNKSKRSGVIYLTEAAIKSSEISKSLYTFSRCAVSLSLINQWRLNEKHL